MKVTDENTIVSPRLSATGLCGGDWEAYLRCSPHGQLVIGGNAGRWETSRLGQIVLRLATGLSSGGLGG